MEYLVLAELVLVFHLGFILFVALGALLVFRWRRVAWAHLPCALWGVLIEFQGWVCPLTPLENRFRRLGGEAGYSGGFIEHYLAPLVYPSGLTRGTQIRLGIAVLAFNLIVYGLVAFRHRRTVRPKAPSNDSGGGA